MSIKLEQQQTLEEEIQKLQNNVEEMETIIQSLDCILEGRNNEQGKAAGYEFILKQYSYYQDVGHIDRLTFTQARSIAQQEKEENALGIDTLLDQLNRLNK